MKDRVLITGASRGIGKAIALYLADKGYELVVHCRSQIAQAQSVIEQVEAVGGSASLLQFDIADRQQAKDVLEQDVENNGAYYGVVCNAGIASDAAFPALTGKDWDQVLHTNLDGFYNVLQPIVMPMIQRRKAGRIITLSSVSGLMGNRG